VRITDEQIAADGVNIKAWAAAMQIAGRGPDAPNFKVKGPCIMTVRRRRLSGAVGTATGPYSFMGDEEFKLSGVHVERLPSAAYVTITVQMIPTTAGAASDISGTTLPLEEAIENFEGLEDFALQFRGALPKPKTPAAIAAVEREANPSWGMF
jgi:hypothetical protein